MLQSVRLVALRRALRDGERQSAPERARALLARMNLVYFDGGDDFEEVIEFTRECSRECVGRAGKGRGRGKRVGTPTLTSAPVSPPRFGMQLLWYRSSYKEGLARLIEETGATAILMGTRRSDPHAGAQSRPRDSRHGPFHRPRPRAASLDPFTPTSAGWPPLMRVNPVLHWSFHAVWAFLRRCRVRYVSLYDQGCGALPLLRSLHRLTRAVWAAQVHVAGHQVQQLPQPPAAAARRLPPARLRAAGRRHGAGKPIFRAQEPHRLGGCASHGRSTGTGGEARCGPHPRRLRPAGRRQRRCMLAARHLRGHCEGRRHRRARCRHPQRRRRLALRRSRLRRRAGLSSRTRLRKRCVLCPGC